MKTAIEKMFIAHGRQRRAMYHDDEIALVPREYAHRVSRIDGACSMVFDIVSRKTQRTAGELALRVGEGASLFYLGHIGYHIDPPYRGASWALRACRLCLPVFEAMQMRSFVITTDDDNFPSIKTCERLGCILESTVDVPIWCREEFEISCRKRPYIYSFSKA